MKAVICTKYGPPEVLQVKDVPKPTCSDNQLLVKIMATAVNSGDVRVRGFVVKGVLKIIMGFVLGFSKPRKPVLGTVFSGIVEQVGNDIHSFKPGDRVFGITGFKFGTYAAYIAVAGDSIVTFMPANAGFEEAAALPFGWHTALHFLKKAGIEERKGLNVLIYGATGSVGTAALQLGRHHHARVTAVCSSAGGDLANRLGAHEVILYDKEDFTKTSKKFDIIFDAVGKISKKQCRHLLNTGGKYVTVGGLDIATENVAQLIFLCDLFENGECDAVIDRVYPFHEIVEAHRYVDTGRKKGNVVITMHEQ